MKKPVTLALEPEIRAQLERIAAIEERSRSQVANRALREWLATRPATLSAPPAPHRAAA